MSKPKAPPPPDYAGLAREQGLANVEAARLAGRLNNPEIYNPYGQREVTFGADVGNQFNQTTYDQAMAQYRSDLEKWRLDPQGRPRPDTDPNKPMAPDTANFFGGFDPNRVIINETLSPEAQQLFDQQMRISQDYGNIAERGLGRLGEAFGTEFDASALPTVQDPNTGVFNTVDFSGAPEVGDYVMGRQRVEQALFDRLNPQLDRARQQREEELLLRGQGMGGRAWQTAQEDLARAETEAQLGAVLGAGQEQSRMFDMATTNRNRAIAEILQQTQLNREGVRQQYGLQEANRQRALQEALALRNLPLSEINALRTGSQPTVPQFQQYQGQSVQPAPLFDAGVQQYNAALGASNAANAQQGALMGSLGALGGGLFSGAGAAGGFGALFSRQ